MPSHEKSDDAPVIKCFSAFTFNSDVTNTYVEIYQRIDSRHSLFSSHCLMKIYKRYIIFNLRRILHVGTKVHKH